uniref:Uncharacterized protein n=1 Tax=Brugia malayi TaxID=6279 RepID=A8PNL8_BRUMA
MDVAFEDVALHFGDVVAHVAINVFRG